MEALTWELLLAVGLLNAGLAVSVVFRRFFKNRFLARKNESYLRWLRILKRIIAGKVKRVRVFSLGWDSATEDGLWELLDSASPEQRTALEAWSRSCGFSDALQARLRNSGKWKQARAAAMLGRLQLPEALPELVRLLERGPLDAQRASVTALARLGRPEAIGPLMRFLARQGVSHSRHVLSALISCGRDEPGSLALYLNHPLAFVRTAAAGALAEVTSASEVPSLASATADREPQVRAHLARALGRAGDARGFPALDRLLADPVWYVRLQAAGALSRIQVAAVPDRLLKATCDQDWRVREKAAAALYRRVGDPVYLLRRVRQELRDRYALGALVSVLEREGAIWRAVHNVCSPAIETRLESQALVAELLRAGRPSSVAYALEAHPDAAVRRELRELVRTYADPAAPSPAASPIPTAMRPGMATTCCATESPSVVGALAANDRNGAGSKR